MLLKKCEILAQETLKKLLPLEQFDKGQAVKQPAQTIKPKKATEIPNNGYLDWEWPIEKISAFLRALDYGPLKVLGTPMCVWDNKYYEIKKYKLSDSSNYYFPKVIALNEENGILLISERNKSIELKLKIKS